VHQPSIRQFTQTPTFDHITWSSSPVDTFNYFAAPQDFTKPKNRHASCPTSRDSQFTDLPFETREARLTPQILCRDIPGVIGKLSPISSGLLDEMETKHPLSTSVEYDSESFAPRTLRPRSRRPRDPRAASEPTSPLKLGCSVPVAYPGNVSVNYRQLSAREINHMKLEPYQRYYKCLIDGCDRFFGRKSNAENHVRTHLDDKPFICSFNTW
jgi:hypothetical protein